MVWPPSTKTWSLTAANIIASTARRCAGSVNAVSSVRSAESLERVSMNRRYHGFETGDRHGLRRQRADGEARRLVAGVVRHEREAVYERERAVVAVEMREQVGHRDEHGEPGAPTSPAVRRAEVEPGAHDLGRAHPRVEQPEHRLRDHERDAFFESVAQPGLQMTDRIVVGPRLDEHVAVAHLGRESAGVVGPHVERAARHEVEAGVVPMAGDETGLDRALVEGEAEVRAAVLDRVRRAVGQNTTTGTEPTLVSSRPVFLQLRQRSCPNRLIDHLGSLRLVWPSFCKCSIAII